ncbi:PEGA domain-containing protein [Myxococcus fulvus]|uniref:PEGA domain-containing protein n=1 Tax=Myxococcus fulvus TaxID=33 RepID=A0A511SYW1_MYXFU|nr:PEGA domain-containing protein [Myxococcus fulvus]GEN07084.1 hypothetical protein MFU01_21210 [Myxococcus fulvus]SEU00280.1 PEGA domain-containing protein [Myxococcus fulvus]
MKQKTWIAVIVVGTLAINAMAYVVVRKRRASDVPPPPPVSGTTTAPTPPVAVPAPPSEDANEGLSRARRAAGLAALEDRDYDIAVREFTEALSLRRTPGGDLVELLRIATDLQSRERDRTRVEPPKPTREPAVTRTPPRAKPSRASSSRTSTHAKEEPPPPVLEEPRNGLLLVTSTPPGLVVQVDGKAVDMTPARLPLRPGTYRVALAQGERRLMEETVVLEEDGVHSLNRDVSEQLAPPTPPRPVANTAPAETPPTPPATAAPVAVKAEATGRGELDISSPSLYGEVWVNNRPYGFPPLVAQNLPAGPARVEVRVNGEVKRRMSVEVEAGRRVAVRVR